MVELIAGFWTATTGGGAFCTANSGESVLLGCVAIDTIPGRTYNARMRYRTPDGVLHTMESGNMVADDTRQEFYSDTIWLTDGGVYLTDYFEIYENGLIVSSGSGQGSGRCEQLTVTQLAETHNICIGGICTTVMGAGNNECSNPGGACGSHNNGTTETNYAAWALGITGMAGIYYLLTRQTARVKSGYESAKREYGRARTAYRTLRNR